MPPRRRSITLTRDDWVEAALAMAADVGVDRIAAEPLAARLGVTKGSFYWHFDTRDALVVAVLDRWERSRTTAVIDDVDDTAPHRLEHLVRHSFDGPLQDATEWAILAAATHPLVAPVVERVHDARIRYLTTLFADHGLPAERAAARARVLYAAYLGHQMLLAHGSRRGDAGVRRSYLDELSALATAP